MADEDVSSAPDRLLAGSYRRPFQRSLTRDFLGHTFSEQARLAEAAAAAAGAASETYEREVETHFEDAVSTKRSPRWPYVSAAVVSAGSALAYLFT